MALHEYRLISCWVACASLDEVALLFRDTCALAAWFPAAVRSVRVLDAGDDEGVGRVLALQTKGWLPYTLDFCVRVSDISTPMGFSLDVWGDFKGHLVCRAVEEVGCVKIYFDWNVCVRKPLLRHWSWLLRPLFVSNHRWVLARGQESLDLELSKRRDGGSALPSPPGPTFPHGRFRNYMTSPVWSLAELLPGVPERVREP